MVMEKMILILDADEEECGELCALLNDQQFCTVPIHSLPEMITFIQDIECLVVIIDLDTVPIDNRTIRELTLNIRASIFYVFPVTDFTRI